ncbi:hypothetical protein KPL70_002937 [Citrus sinensis]|uniref:uncharacterized protein LOC102619953 isoform X3 n=1 Tax=Citrus sinensis TaxID=2711 RepID=UPI00219EBB8C|nr:uncharacterized protein LOC102619953 isoform X3 [Citrus sinensis]KAH9742419.1 hypothetical protein KPL70_002937 [Citrus sinensis]
MATEADMPEPITIRKGEGEITYPGSGHFDSTADETFSRELKKFQGTLNVPPDTVEYLGETKDMQAASDFGAEAMNTAIKFNVETAEGETFLGSPSAVQVSIEDTCRVSKSSEPEEVTLQAGNEAPENGKQTQNTSTIEVAGERGTEENKVTEDSQEKPVEDKSNEKETSAIHNYEKDGTMTDVNTDLGSNEQVVNVLEAVSDRNKEDLIHIPDPTVISLNKSVETVVEPCVKAESTTEVEFTGEEMTDTSFTEAEKSSNLTDEVPEATKPSEGVADENEKEKSTYEGAEGIFPSTTDIQRNEEAILKIRERDNEMLDTQSVTPATDVSGVYEAEPEESAKLKEASSILCEKKSQDETELSKDITNNKNSIDTPAMQTEGKDIVKESPEEVNEQIEMTEKSAGKDYESRDQKGDGSIMKDEDTSSINEELPAKEASSGGNSYEEESSVTATKDDVTDREITDAFEQNQNGTTNHEDRPENLQQEKPKKEKLEGSLNLLAEEFNKAAETEQAEAITTVNKETPIKSEEESLEREIKNVSEVDEKTECAEVEAQNKNASDLHDIPVLDEEAGETEGKDLEEVIKTEPKGTIQEANEEYTKEEEKDIEDAPEACQSSNSTIIEQTPLEEAESAELILKASETDEKKLQEASGLDFDKTSVIMDKGENTNQETQKIGEACDATTEEILANIADAETSVEVNNAVFVRDEKAKENIQAERSPLEVAPELTDQDESGIVGDNEKRNNITHEEVHDGTKITDSVVAIDGQVIEGNVAHISAESIEKPNVESSEGNVAERSEGENDIEQVTEDSSVRCLAPESVEEVPVKNLEQESTGEIPEKSDTAEATDSIGQETSKNKESPKEIVDDSKVKGDSSLEEKRNEDINPAMVAEERGDYSEPADDNGKKTSKTVEDLTPILQKNEPGDELPQLLSKISDKNEAFNSDADKSPGDEEEGPTQKLEETLQVEGNEKAEMKNDTDYSKTATEESSVELETTNASKVAEKQTAEMEKNVDQSREVEEKKIEESIQEDENVAKISEQGNDTSISQLSGEFEEAKSEKSSQEDDKVPEVSKQGNDTYTSPLSIEQETLVTEGNIHKEEKSEGENNGHHDMEENNSRGLIPESELVEQSSVKNLENDNTEEDKSAGEIFDNSEALGTGESTVHKTSTTIESTTEILDPSHMKHGDSSQNEENQLTAVEPSAEDKGNEDRGPAMMAEEKSNENELLAVKDNSENKPSIGQEDSKHILQENELQKKNAESLSVRSDENEESVVDADKSPCLMEIGTQDLNEAPWKKDNDKDTEEKNDTKDNQIAMEENLEINAESSDASKTTENAVSELKSEKDQMLVQDEIQKEESEELYEDSNDGVKNEKECSTTDKLPEPIGEESLQSSKEYEKEEETPENQASVELKTTSGSEDSEKQTLKVERNADPSRGVEEEGIEQSSQEDDMAAEMSKQGNDTYISPVSIEKETSENSDGTKFKEEKTEVENSTEQNVKESNSGGLIPESVDQSPVMNLEDNRKREDKSTREIFENSKTSGAAEIAAHETSTTIDSSLVKQVENVQNEENNLTATESSAEQKINEDGALVILAEGNSNDNEPIGAKDNIEKKSSIGKEDLQHIQQENEPEGKHERLSLVMSDENEAFSTNADKSPSLMEVEASGDLNEAPRKEDNDKETEEKVDTEENKIVDEANHEIAAESSDASKSTDVLDLKSEEEKMLVHDEMKEELSKELYEDTKNAEICDTEDIVQHSKQDASSSLVEGLVEKNSKEDESKGMQSKDQVDESIPFIEETEAASSAGETVCTTLEVRAAESNVDSYNLGITKDSEAETQLNETNASLIEEPVRASQMSNKETEEEMKEKEETTIGDSDSATIAVVAEAEPEEKKQVESFGPAFEEKAVVETETKVMVLESADINEKPQKASNLGEKYNNEIPPAADNAGETNGGLIQESSMVSHISNKETEEEIKETEDTSIEDSDSVSVTVVTEAQGLQEAEPEEQKQVAAFRDKDIAETESKEAMPESVDMNVKPEHTSDLGEKRGREIPKVADEDREIIDCKIQNDAPHAGDEDQTEETTKDKPLEEISKDELKEYSTMKSKENELSTEVIESVDKPPAQDDVLNVNTETACVAQAIDETFVNKQDNTTNPVNVSELESVDIKKEAANEEIQKHEIEDLYVHPELENAKSPSMSEVVEITKGEITGKLADQADICKLTTLKDLESSNLELQMEKTEDGKPFDEVLKASENSVIRAETEKGILEQEIFKRNLKEVIEVEDTGIEQKGEALKDEVEENSSYKSNHEDDKEIMEKEEPQLEAEDHKEQNANETTKAVILTEKDGVEQSDDSEDIKEMIMEEECANAFNDALSTVGEKTDEMEDSTPVCRENKKAADLKEKTKTENTDIGEDSAREGEPSFGVESEEQKVLDISIEPSSKDLKENTGEIFEEPQDCYRKIDNASLTVETDKSSGKAEIEEKLVKVFHIDSDEPSLEATETEKCQEGKEAGGLILEETSEPLMNDSGQGERVCAIENGDAGEPEESKIASEESKSRNAEAEFGKSQTVETPDQVPTDNDDHAASENPGLDEIEETKMLANEVNEVKEVSDSVYESREQVTEEAEVEESQTVEKPNQVPPNHGDNDDAERQRATLENTGSDEAEETKIVSNAVDETKDQVSKETAENGASSTVEKMDHPQSSNFEHAQKESVAVENRNADEVNEIKEASDATYESNERDIGESAGEIPTVEKLDQAPPANSVPMQYSNAEEVGESKIESVLASKSKDQSTEDIDVTGKNTTEEKPDAENTEEACKAASDYRAQAIEPVTENEITTDQTPSAEKTSAPMAPKHETTVTVEEIEEEKQQKVEKLEDEGPCLQTEEPRELEVSTMGFKIHKDLQDNPTEAYEEEGHTPDGALEPWGIEKKLKSTDASSESKALQSEAVIHSQEEVAGSEDTEIKEKHLIEAISEVRTEENQCKKTIEGNEITETEVSKEQITEEKEVEETCQPVSICEGMNKSLEDDGQKAEECRGDETDNAFKTAVNKIQYEKLLEETEKGSASLNIGRQDVAEDIIVEDSHQVSEENMIAKEGCPNEFEGKEAGDSAIKLDASTQGEESNYGSGKAEATTPENEESSMAMSEKESVRGFATESKIIQETSELEKSSCATTEEQIPAEADLIESPYTPVQTGDEFAPKIFEQQGTTETPQKAKINLEGEQQPQESGERKTEKSALMDSATASLTDPLQSSRIETTKVAEQVGEGGEPKGRTEEIQTKQPEAIHVEDAKMDEEQEGDEHKRIDSSSDAPVTIEAKRDAVDVKVAHKKSHNILSGVGSKVKHSISKVKKAITGKSSHPKQVSPK